MDISLITKYRTPLMGIAILWVMFFHSPMYIPENLSILSQIKKMGYGGVDIFMFLSGMGIYYSLNKNPSIKEFYKRRFFRIIPYYTPIVLLSSLIFYYRGDISLSTVFFNVTTISLWIYRAGLFEWYIPTILAFYLISPFLYSCVKKEKNLLLISIFILTFLFFYLIGGNYYSYLLMPVGRFPLFLFGLYLGHRLVTAKNTSCNKYQILLLFVLLVVGIYLWNYWLLNYWPKYWSSDNNGYGLSFVPFWFITFPLCAFISLALSMFKNYKYPILTFFGANTLVFYIFHERIMDVMIFYGMNKGVAIIAFVLTIIIGIAWKNIVDKVISFFTNKKRAL